MHRGGKRAPPNHPLVRSLRCKPWVGDWQHSKVFHSSSIGYCKEVQQGFPLCIEIIETWVISIHWVQCRDVSHATDYRGLPPCLTLLLFLSDTQNNQRNINLPALQLCVCLCVLVGFSVSKSRGVCVKHMCVKSIHSLFRVISGHPCYARLHNLWPYLSTLGACIKMQRRNTIYEQEWQSIHSAKKSYQASSGKNLTSMQIWHKFCIL